MIYKILRPFLAFGFAILFFYGYAGNKNTLSKENITISTEQAEVFGKILISYNGRIAPLQTFAQDFTLKITGKNSYKYADAVQVLSGFLFFPESWYHVPVFEIKSRQMQIFLGISKKQAAIKDFFDLYGNYKLAPYYAQMYSSKNQTPFIKEALFLNEKFQLIRMVQNGSLLKIFPIKQSGNVFWVSPTDMLSQNLSYQDYVYIRNLFPLYHKAITQKQ